MLLFEYAHLAPDIRFRGHGHDRWHLCVVLSGDFQEVAEGGLRDCPADVARLSSPGVLHDLAFGSEGATCLLVESSGEFWNRVFRRSVRNGGSVFGSTDARAFAERVSHGGAGSLAAALGELFAALRDPAVADGSRTPPIWLEDVRQAMQEDPGWSPSHSVRQRTHLARSFLAFQGFSPTEYRTLLRVQRAQRCLDQGASLAEAALDAGFSHQSHMTNAFREVLGLAPGAWRSAGLRDIPARHVAIRNG